VTIQTEDQYEDLLGLWSDLEAGLGIILGSSSSVQEFEQRVWQYDRWLKVLLERDTDIGLYLLFQLATNSPAGYSASHALVSAVMCHLIAVELKLPQDERDSLVHAALTMNIAMTGLQDQLAEQIERPSAEQQDAIQAHAAKGVLLLGHLGVVDPRWLDAVARHHDETTGAGALARILRIVDRYAAMISPRKSREGRTTTDSAQLIVANSARQQDGIGQALVSAVGLYPPGTYVRLDSQELAVVTRRSNVPGRPFVAVVVNAAGAPLNPPHLHQIADASRGIKAALTASAIHVHLNHHLILQLGVDAAR
jgi:HD-GYP domain-containing protein (c-di-GMP phosphodiesterase class II)